MSSRREHLRAAPRAEPERLACRHRLAAAAAAGDEERLLDLTEEVAPLVRGRAVDAQADARAGVEQGPHRGDAGAEAQVRRRAVGDARPGLREARHLPVGEVHAVRAPDVVREPAEPFEVLHGRAPVELPAVRLLLHGLGEVRVEHQAEPPRERRGLLHQPSRDRERRARRDRELHPRSGAALVEGAVEPLGLGEHRVELLDELVGRQAAVGGAEVHRAARRDESHAELARRLDLRLEDAGPAAREDVMVVEDGRAAGERQLGEPRARGGVLRLRVDPRPHGVQLAEPGEEVGLLRPRAGKGLVEVVMGVDEPRRHDGAADVDSSLVRRLLARPDRLDGRALDEHPAVGVLGAGVVHRDDPAVRVERRHAGDVIAVLYRRGP